jgi:CopG family transcriptional regulator/antitoxin EndoAI
MLRKTKLITISIFPDLLEKLNRIAKEESRTRSELLREAMRRYIEEREYQAIVRYARDKAEEVGVKTEEDVYRLVGEGRS